MTSTAYAYNVDTKLVIAKVTATESQIALATLNRQGYMSDDEIGICFDNFGLQENDDTIVIENI